MGLANAESECYDPVEGLADDIGLNASEWDHWIRTPIRIRTLDPAKTIWFTELTQTTELDRGQGFLVPNAIYAHWGGVLRGDGRDCASCGFQGNLKAFAPELMAKIIEERTEDPQATFKAAFQKVDNKYRKYFAFKSGIMEPIRDVFPMQ